MQRPEVPGFLRVTRWVTDATGWRERHGCAGGEPSINSDIIEATFAAAGAYAWADLLEQLELHIAPLVPDRRGDLHVLPRLLRDGTRLYDVADGSMRKLQDLGRR
jgi:hypothetical protein